VGRVLLSLCTQVRYRVIGVLLSVSGNVHGHAYRCILRVIGRGYWDGLFRISFRTVDSRILDLLVMVTGGLLWTNGG
jgi:hypothetical protein